MATKSIDLTNKEFGHLTAIKPLNINGVRKWECKCNCGKIIQVRTGHLTCGGYTSCGCKRGKIKNLNARWKGCGEISGFMWKGIYLTYKKNKKLRDFFITIDYIWALFNQQNRKCAISGLPICFAKTNELHKQGQTTASLDRIDSSRGYIEGNVQWVHKNINKLKSNFNQDYFIALCKIIGKYNENSHST